MRVKIASTGTSLQFTKVSQDKVDARDETHFALVAETYIPSWAIITPTQVCLMSVLFPAIFGPVKSMILSQSPPILTSLAIKSFPPFCPKAMAMPGCRNSSKSKKASSRSTNSGRQLGVPIASLPFFKLTRQSSSAVIRTALSQTFRCSSKAANSLPVKFLMQVLRFSRASLSLRI